MRSLLTVLVAVAALVFAPVRSASAADFDLAFQAGKSYGVMSNSVVRGDRDNYYFGARSGQMVTIAISSIEDNAVVELYFKRGGEWILAEAPPDSRALYGALPDSDGSLTVAPSAPAQARARLGPDPMEWLFARTGSHWAGTCADADRWHQAPRHARLVDLAAGCAGSPLRGLRDHR